MASVFARYDKADLKFTFVAGEGCSDNEPHVDSPTRHKEIYILFTCMALEAVLGDHQVRVQC
jgi:hypothetical protein